MMELRTWQPGSLFMMDISITYILEQMLQYLLAGLVCIGNSG